MLNRRKLFALTLSAAALSLTPAHVGAVRQVPSTSLRADGTLIQRAIPSTGEMVPAIGLAFSNHPGCADHAALKEVVKTFADSGGRYIDLTLGNAANQQFHMDAASELGVANKLLWSSTAFIPGPNPAPDGGVKTQIDSVLARTKAAKVDLAWVTAAGPPGVLAALKDEKKAGRVRYIGVMTISVKSQAAQLEALMRNEPIDFIGVDYDVSNRFVEDKILPLAQERKIGVVAFLPFNNASGLSCTGGTSLFTRVANKPLPDWAAEFDAKSWAQFFLKYVLSHPAVTVVRTGTTKATHMVDNLGGGIGRLPSEAMRQRMAAFVDALPAAAPPKPPAPPSLPPGISLPAAILDRYVGEYKAASGFTAIFRREGAALFVKPGNNPEVALLARSETRFQDPRGPVFEFQLDGQGKVTGAVLEQQGPQGIQKTPLERK
jgi:aryl-alcohol dehydrogenase-like predicted oxidoreductase